MSSIRHLKEVKLTNPSLIVCWKEDDGNLAPGVMGFLIEKLKAKYFCEIEPAGFFYLEGARLKGDVVEFPESRFYAVEDKNLIIFKSNYPSQNWWMFLNLVLDVAQHHCKVKELYTVNGLSALIPHTASRRILTVYNHERFKDEIRDYGFLGMDFSGPPAMSSFLLWVAKRRDMPGLSIWEDIPFYLAPFDDLEAQGNILRFFDQKFDLGIDLEEFEERIREQKEKMALFIKESPEIGKYIGMLEGGFSLTAEEQSRLTEKFGEIFRR